MDLTSDWLGFSVVAVFIVAYLFVVIEEFTHIRKSLPLILAAGVMWTLIGIRMSGVETGGEAVASSVRSFLEEFAEIFLFLLVAMTFVNTMSERGVFDALRARLTSASLTYRQLFWATGALSFVMSPVLDNMTTALVMGTVLMALDPGNRPFIAIGCINIVVAANAGGAFSPFGDITTLMVWQSGKVGVTEFTALLLPSLINFLVPATIMSVAVPKGAPTASTDVVHMKRGARRVMVLFGATVMTALSFEHFLHIPPFLGMMTGLAVLGLFAFYLLHTHNSLAADVTLAAGLHPHRPFDSFEEIAKAEWDTLLFFFGVILCVGALGFVGYLELLAQGMYVGLNPTIANTLVGVLSAVVDNIPVMVAVLQMNPQMDLSQWLLVTLTAGVGGSLLSVGSAAGVALMGQARGRYTFFAHLKWSPVVALGFAASIWAHLFLNG